MPGIYNVNNGYNVNTKKISSKLTFEVGERFTGRVVSKGDGNDVTIKLSDGWQFIAELEGDVNLDDIKLVKFQVDGFKNGKLKLKVSQGTGNEEAIGDENFQEVIEKEGLSKEDIDILKNMVKHNIPLTKENINQIKGLIQFNEKMASNPKEIDAFIQTYLQSKDIPSNSEQGQVIKESLTKFLAEFKNMSQEDIISFIENNLEFSEENINSFNKLFKGGSSIEQILTKISDSLSSQEVSDNNIETVMNNKLINKEAELIKNIFNTNTSLASKAYNENDPLTKKINVLDVLKILAGNADSELDLVQKNSDQESSNTNTEKVNLPISLIKKSDNQEIVKLIKDTIGDSLKANDSPKTQAESLIESTNKVKLEGILSKIEGKEVKLTDSEFKHNISLIRENINEIKGLIQFNEKLASNPKEIDAFIQTYLKSKDIPANSEQGQAVNGLLTKFLGEFKDMTPEDILAFIENNSDSSEENITSFNKLFKGSSSIEQIITKISDSLNSLEISDNISDNNIETVMNNKLINKEAELTKNIFDNNTSIASKAYNANDSLTKKINILDVLRTLAGSEDSELDMVQRNASKESGNAEKINLSTSLIKKLEDKDVIKLIKDTIGNSLATNHAPKTQAESLIEATNKTKLEGILSNIESKEVKLTDSEFKAFKELLNNKIDGKEVLQENVINDKNIIQAKEASTNALKETVVIKESLGKANIEDLARGNLDNKEAIKTEMKDKIENIRDIVKNLITQTDSKEAGYEKIMNLVKANINDIKVFNSISDEYYYLNIPITADSKEYPCKLIIKDNRKDGKKIDSTNAKMVVSVKTINLGEVDGYLTMRENKIDVKLKCESDFTSVLKNNKSKLADGLSSLGLFVNISVSAKDKPVDLVSCRNFFNDLTISTIDIKV